MSRPLVLLDRDGVINRDLPEHVRSLQQWQVLDGAPKAIAALSRAGFQVMVCTNQSGLARGFIDAQELDRIHAALRGCVTRAGGEIADILVCPHQDGDDCDCRKPRPGLLLEAARRAGVRIDNVPFIGDSARDLAAATAVGARPILVETGKGRQTRSELERLPEVYPDLSAAAAVLIAEREPNEC